MLTKLLSLALLFAYIQSLLPDNFILMYFMVTPLYINNQEHVVCFIQLLMEKFKLLRIAV